MSMDGRYAARSQGGRCGDAMDGRYAAGSQGGGAAHIHTRTAGTVKPLILCFIAYFINNVRTFVWPFSGFYCDADLSIQ